MSDFAKWAIRDIEHGKTFYFDTIDDLANFVRKLDAQVPPKCSSCAGEVK